MEVMSEISDRQAYGLAQRWASKCKWCARQRNASDGNAECTDALDRPLPMLNEDERDELFVWVRRELTLAPCDRLIAARDAYLATRMGLSTCNAAGLREASGWTP